MVAHGREVPIFLSHVMLDEVQRVSDATSCPDLVQVRDSESMSKHFCTIDIL